MADQIFRRFGSGDDLASAGTEGLGGEAADRLPQGGRAAALTEAESASRKRGAEGPAVAHPYACSSTWPGGLERCPAVDRG
jgi:hypothetical protein